ncbi:MAG: nuclear transport factor 2 family protein [Pirellulales bacterium]
MTAEDLFEIVSALERKVWNTVVEGDGAALGELFADDYIEITLDGRRIEKNEIVELSPQVDEIDRYAVGSERGSADWG